MAKTSWQEVYFLDQDDLTDKQVEITRQTYREYADRYVLNYERRQGALEEARLFTLDPFLRSFEKYNLSGKVLFAGCGSGRDLQEASKQGFTCVGVDISLQMINIGKIMGIKEPLMEMDLEELDFPNNSFAGIFCETAIAHVKKKSLPKVLENFARLLTKDGLLLLTFRKGDGRVYRTEDKVGGKRYYTTFLAKEAISILNQAGFEVLSKSSHKVGSRPPYYNLLTRLNK